MIDPKKLVAYQLVLTPPTNLHDYREDQPPGRRSRPSTAPPAAEPTAPAGEAANGQDGRPAVRRSAARLTVPVQDVKAFTNDPADPDIYMQRLLKRQAPPATPAAAEQPPSSSDEDDAWFDAQATPMPQAASSTPAGLGSAALTPHTAGHRQALGSRPRLGQRRSSTREITRAPRRAVKTVAAVAVLGLVAVTVAALSTSPPRPTRAIARMLPAAITPTSFDAYSAKTRPRLSLTSRTTVSRDRQRTHARPRPRRLPYRHPQTTSTRSQPTVTKTAPIVRPAPAVSTTTTSAQTPTYIPTTPKASSSPSASAANHQPAYGPKGTLGPGSSPNG